MRVGERAGLNVGKRARRGGVRTAGGERCVDVCAW